MLRLLALLFIGLYTMPVFSLTNATVVASPHAGIVLSAEPRSELLYSLYDFLGLERDGIYAYTPNVDAPFELKLRQNTIAYGRSELGRELLCTVLEPVSYDRTVLLVFAIHGYEDSYGKDGQVLVDTGRELIKHYQTIDALGECRLMVVTCANPDGLLDGGSNQGYGRCNALGIDINRDFNAAHKVLTEPRSYTAHPFSASESRALKNLVIRHQPDVVIDCHGWLGCTIGDEALARVFREEMALKRISELGDNRHGYFAYWAHRQGARSLLVEFTEPGFDKRKFFSAVDRLVAIDFSDRARIASLVYTQ